MTSVLLQICFLSACSNTLLLQNAHPLNINNNKALAVAGRSSRAPPAAATAVISSSSHINNSHIHQSSWRHRHSRRNHGAPASPYRWRRRTASFFYCPAFLQKTSRSFALAPAVSRRREVTRHPSPTSATTAALEQMLAIHNSLEEAMLRSGPTSSSQHQTSSGYNGGPRTYKSDRACVSEEMAPPPSRPSSSNGNSLSDETRSTRSESSASRSTNRLSLTLPIPIAPPTAHPTRPTPTSTTMAYPPTPLDTPSLMSPVDPADFITAIAAQERRVLELREELARAEAELNKLKKQWTAHEAHKKRAEIRNVEPLLQIGAGPLLVDTSDLSDPATRRSTELDRRKALLLGQQSQQGTPTQNRRRVFRGGHTRTLSLLSPTKTSDGFSVHDDNPDDNPKSPSLLIEDSQHVYITQYAPTAAAASFLPAQLAKRASWAPNSVHQASGVKQIAQDFKAGLWTFMEDLRQATVGDEPITRGQGPYVRGTDSNGNTRTRDSQTQNQSPGYNGENQDTIRASASAASRPRATATFGETETPTPGSRFVEVQGGNTKNKHTTLSRSKTAPTAKNTKHFSWTPLVVDAYDDNDWSSWDSPSAGVVGVNKSSPRWSSTTVNSDVPEHENRVSLSPTKEQPTPSRLRNSSPAPPSSPTNKLEELLPPMLNRLTPSNIKRTASDFMKEWEKSLSSPPLPPLALEGIDKRTD